MEVKTDVDFRFILTTAIVLVSIAGSLAVTAYSVRQATDNIASLDTRVDILEQRAAFMRGYQAGQEDMSP